MPGDGWNGYQIILLRLLFSSLILRAFCYASVSNRSASSLLLSVTATHIFGFPVPCCLLPEQSFLRGLESNGVEAVHYASFVDRFAFFGPPCPLLAASSRRLLLYLRVVKMHKPGKRPKWCQKIYLEGGKLGSKIRIPQVLSLCCTKKIDAGALQCTANPVKRGSEPILEG